MLLYTCKSCRMKGEMTANKSEFVSTFDAKVSIHLAGHKNLSYLTVGAV